MPTKPPVGNVVGSKRLRSGRVNNNHLVVKVFLQHDLEVLASTGFVLNFRIMLKHLKMYITISDFLGEKRIDPVYLTWSKDVAIVRVFRYNALQDKGTLENTADNK